MKIEKNILENLSVQLRGSVYNPGRNVQILCSAEYGETPSNWMEVEFKVKKFEFLLTLVFFYIAIGFYYYPKKRRQMAGLANPAQKV